MVDVVVAEEARREAEVRVVVETATERSVAMKVGAEMAVAMAGVETEVAVAAVKALVELTEGTAHAVVMRGLAVEPGAVVAAKVAHSMGAGCTTGSRYAVLRCIGRTSCDRDGTSAPAHSGLGRIPTCSCRRRLALQGTDRWRR